MNDSIKINTTKYKDIVWLLVVLYVARLVMIDNDQLFLFVYLGLILIVIGFAKKIYLPNVVGLYPYMILVTLMAAIGLVLRKTRYLERDLFYILPTIFLVILGYYLFSAYRKKSIVKTIVIYGLISSVYSFILFLTKIGEIAELQDLRDVFNVEIYEICLIFLVLVVYIFNPEECVFGKKIDVVIMIVFLANIILSMSRSVWVEIIVGFPIIIIINLFSNARRASTYVKTFIVIFVAAVGVAILYTYAPANILEDYTVKVENTSDELNEKQEFNSIEDAMGNWRAYENQSAIKQWESGSPVTQIFGAGLGKGIYIKYVPYSWSGLDEEQTIPLLHNGYYTMLAKGGVAGVVILIFFLFYPAIVGIKSLRRKGYSNEAVILIVISIVFAVQTYVTRGPIVQHPNITWGVLVGWMCGQIKSEDY